MKSQKSVSLSRSEVECVASSEAIKEVMYVIQLLGSMKILVDYPVMVRAEYVDAIFMATNIINMACTKHNIRCKIVNEYV